MTAKEILDRLSNGYQTYLNGDVKPVAGYDDKFYDGVLWAFSRLTEIQPSVEDLIDNAPTVEPKRPEGEWIRTGSLGNGNAQYECSNCHHGDEQAESQEVPYCWHCGAKMTKGGEVE